MADVERNMDSKPLTAETLSDVTSDKPLSPSDLLTMKSKVMLPPAEKFQRKDLCTRKYRTRSHHLAKSSGAYSKKKYFCSCRNVKNGITEFHGCQ